MGESVGTLVQILQALTLKHVAREDRGAAVVEKRHLGWG